MQHKNKSLWEWYSINDYEGYYEISETGIVKGVCRMVVLPNGKLREIPERILKTRLNNRGYLDVRLSKNGETRTKFIHILLAQTFTPNPESKPYVNHINGIKTDNRIVNLEWVTHAENITHAYNTKLIAKKGRLIVDTCEGKIFVTLKEASDSYKLNPHTLRNYLNGGIKNNPTCLEYGFSVS